MKNIIQQLLFASLLLGAGLAGHKAYTSLVAPHAGNVEFLTEQRYFKITKNEAEKQGKNAFHPSSPFVKNFKIPPHLKALALCVPLAVTLNRWANTANKKEKSDVKTPLPKQKKRTKKKTKGKRKYAVGPQKITTRKTRVKRKRKQSQRRGRKLSEKQKNIKNAQDDIKVKVEQSEKTHFIAWAMYALVAYLIYLWWCRGCHLPGEGNRAHGGNLHFDIEMEQKDEECAPEPLGSRPPRPDPNRGTPEEQLRRNREKRKNSQEEENRPLARKKEGILSFVRTEEEMEVPFVHDMALACYREIPEEERLSFVAEIQQARREGKTITEGMILKFKNKRGLNLGEEDALQAALAASEKTHKRCEEQARLDRAIKGQERIREDQEEDMERRKAKWEEEKQQRVDRSLLRKNKRDENRERKEKQQDRQEEAKQRREDRQDERKRKMQEREQAREEREEERYQEQEDKEERQEKREEDAKRRKEEVEELKEEHRRKLEEKWEDMKRKKEECKRKRAEFNRISEEYKRMGRDQEEERKHKLEEFSRLKEEHKRKLEEFRRIREEFRRIREEFSRELCTEEQEHIRDEYNRKRDEYEEERVATGDGQEDSSAEIRQSRLGKERLRAEQIKQEQQARHDRALRHKGTGEGTGATRKVQGDKKGEGGGTESKEHGIKNGGGKPPTVQDDKGKFAWDPEGALNALINVGAQVAGKKAAERIAKEVAEKVVKKVVKKVITVAAKPVTRAAINEAAKLTPGFIKASKNVGAATVDLAQKVKDVDYCWRNTMFSVLEVSSVEGMAREAKEVVEGLQGVQQQSFIAGCRAVKPQLEQQAKRVAKEEGIRLTKAAAEKQASDIAIKKAAKRMVAKVTQKTTKEMLKEAGMQAVGGFAVGVVTDYAFSAIGTAWRYSENEERKECESRCARRRGFTSVVRNMGDRMSTFISEAYKDTPPVEKIIKKNVTGATCSTIGFVVGSAMGPVGAAVGTAVGGAVGAIASWLMGWG